MFVKFELLGISASIVAMIFGLYLITTDWNSSADKINQLQLASVPTARLVVDGTQNNANDTLREVLAEAISADGKFKRLVVTDVRFGVGEPVEKGDTVTVHYIGTLQAGYEFDNSNKRGIPYTFTVGAGKVIKGWEEGIIGMKKGGTRILVIPPALGYGEQGFGPIPKDATLVFSIELLEIK